MRQVAQAAGVGVMTVSYAYTRPERVAEGTRQRVYEAAARLGYRGPDPVARSLRRGETRNLGVILGEHLTYAFEDPQAGRFLAGVSSVCVAQGRGLMLIPSLGTPEDLDRVHDAPVDGFILWTTVDHDPVLSAVQARGLPAAIQGGPAVPGIALVSADDRAAAREIAEVMLSASETPLVLSHPLDRDRWSGLVRGPDPDVPFPVTRHRLLGYRDAWRASGRDWRDAPVAVVPRNTRADGEKAVREALAEVRPDAIIAMSDQLAAGALDALDGSVPVSGWDDGDLAQTLGFSSVRQSLFEQGAQCARIAAGLDASPGDQAWAVVSRAAGTTAGHA